MGERESILAISLNLMSLALSELVGDCMDAEGKPKAPDYRTLMKMRGVLPPYCEHSLNKKVVVKP